MTEETDLSLDQGPEALPQPDKAYKNPDFLNSAAARPVRILCELIEPATRLRHEEIQSTIVFFGSARNLEPEREKDRLTEIRRCLKEDSLKPEVRRQLKITEKQVRLSVKYYRLARELAKKLTEWNIQHEPNQRKRHYICSGGGPGIMEAANRGARDAGGKSVAFGISLPFEQKLNPYCDRETSFDFHYFFLRKYWFLYLARALVVFPGGFGTMDELFEMLTLVQTRKTSKRLPIILMGSEFWNKVINFEALVEWGTISPEDLALFRVIDHVDEAFEMLREHLSKPAEYNSPNYGKTPPPQA